MWPPHSPDIIPVTFSVGLVEGEAVREETHHINGTYSLNYPAAPLNFCRYVAQSSGVIMELTALIVSLYCSNSD
jgi:hypothetical protein